MSTLKKSGNETSANYLPGQLMPFIWRYLKNRKLYLLVFFLCGLLGAVEMTLSPYLLKVIIDAVAQFPENDTLLKAILIPALIYASLPMILNICYRFNSYLHLRLFPEIKSAVNRDMFSYLMHHSHAFFQNHLGVVPLRRRIVMLRNQL